MSNRKTLNLRRATHLADLYDPATVVLFAGLGGACIGIERAYTAGGYANRYVDLAVNHWPVAIGVHKANHPMTQHLAEDVWDVDPAAVLPGRSIAYLHASPDCTHFSKARGSKPKKKHIRGLAWVVVRWAKVRRPTVITLENVEEFKDWGPLAADGQPCPRRKGLTFGRWVRSMQKLGYQVQWRELRACDYGTPTTRKRLFVIARCDGRPIAWPEKTHGRIDISTPQRNERAQMRAGVPPAGLVDPDRLGDGDGRRNRGGVQPHQKASPRGNCTCEGDRQRAGRCRDLRGSTGRSVGDQFGGSSHRKVQRSQCEAFIEHSAANEALTPYRTAAECIDWSLPICSIFATPAEAKAWAVQHGVGVPRRPLKPKTMKRIAAGLVKFVLEAKRPYLVRCAHGDEATTGAARWGHSSHPVTQPVPTVSGSKDFAVVDVQVAPFTAGVGGRAGQSPATAADKPMPTVTGKADRVLAAATLAPFTVPNLGERDGQAPRCGSVEQPAPTVTASASGANVVAAFLSHFYTSNTCGGEGDPCKPAKTVTSGGQHATVVCSMLQTLNHGGEEHRGHSPDEPVATVTAARDARALVYAFLATYYGNSTTGLPVDGPAPTIVSKDRVQLVTVVIYGTTYVVTDIAMRMLTPRELARAQGFDDSYVIDRTAAGEPVTKANQVKLIGNSVCPDVMEAIAGVNVVAAGVLEEIKMGVVA